MFGSEVSAKKFWPHSSKGDAPGIGNGKPHASLEMTARRIVAEEAAVRTADRPVGGFDVAVQKGPFPQVDGTGGVGTKGGDRVMGIVVVETTKDDFLLIGPVVAIGIAKMNEGIAL